MDQMKEVRFGEITMLSLDMSKFRAEKVKCEKCNDTRETELMGGTGSDEWGVVDVIPCDCNFY